MYGRMNANADYTPSVERVELTMEMVSWTK